MRRIGFAAALALGLMPGALAAPGQAKPASPDPSLWSWLSQPARGALIPTGRHIAVDATATHQRGLQRPAAAFAVPPAIRLAHPAGCPARAFCGCGAAVRIFDWPVRELWLAASWLKFPRTAPAPGMVAVRRHHVFVLEQFLGGSTWLAYDANSGRHATQLHARSIDGFVIVNPRAG